MLNFFLANDVPLVANFLASYSTLLQVSQRSTTLAGRQAGRQTGSRGGNSICVHSTRQGMTMRPSPGLPLGVSVWSGTAPGPRPGTGTGLGSTPGAASVWQCG